MFFASALAILILVFQVTSNQQGYYWREYTGTIPTDAVIGGKDVNGNNIYIGQAFVRHAGLMVAPIYPGVKEVYAPFWGVKKVERFIKILCGPQKNFYWILTNSKSFQETLNGKHAVLGGSENNGPLNIGRISLDSETKIGKVDAYLPKNPGFYFNNKGKEKLLTDYEVLVYDKQHLVFRN